MQAQANAAVQGVVFRGLAHPGQRCHLGADAHPEADGAGWWGARQQCARRVLPYRSRRTREGCQCRLGCSPTHLHACPPSLMACRSCVPVAWTSSSLTRNVQRRRRSWTACAPRRGNSSRSGDARCWLTHGCAASSCCTSSDVHALFSRSCANSSQPSGPRVVASAAPRTCCVLRQPSAPVDPPACSGP